MRASRHGPLLVIGGEVLADVLNRIAQTIWIQNVFLPLPSTSTATGSTSGAHGEAGEVAFAISGAAGITAESWYAGAVHPCGH